MANNRPDSSRRRSSRHSLAIVPRGLRQVCNQYRVALQFAERDGEILSVARPGEVESAVCKFAEFLRLAATHRLSPQTGTVEYSGGVIERRAIGGPLSYRAARC